MRIGVRRVRSVLLALVLGICGSGLLAGGAWAAECPNEQLRAEQPYGLGLPDCRAYEMVSPLDKGDSDAILPESDAARSSLSGEVLTWQSLGVFAGAEGSQLENQYIARRGANGWSTRGITPPYIPYSTALGGSYEALAFTPELTAGVARTDVPLTAELLPQYAEYNNLYLADLAVAPVSHRLLTSGTPYVETPRESQGVAQEVAGASTDLSHVVYNEDEHVLEWADGEPEPRLVSVGPEGEPLESAGAGGAEQSGRDLKPGSENDSWRSVSADGLRVMFTSPGGVDSPHKQLYVRENAGQPQSPVGECTISTEACTVEVSKSQRAEFDQAGSRSVRYWGASVDGTHVFFTSCAKLTDNATASAGPIEGCNPGEPGVGNDLYEYDLETGVLSDLTVDEAGDPFGAEVLGVADISEDGTYVYFVAEGKLTIGENPEKKDPVPGESNLYLAHYLGGKWVTSFIATLEHPTTYSGGGGGQEGGDSEDWDESPALDSVRATPDGSRLAFLSTRRFTGYDNEDANTKEADTEIFSYDAESQKLTCVSCNPSGELPIGPSRWQARQASSTALQGYTPRSYSADGDRLVFDSGDALTPQDTNGRQDVYEWEQNGSGGCPAVAPGAPEPGCLFAISNVAGNYESFLLDADPTGENVFFATEDQLVPADTDFHVDVYDARVDGGFPVSVLPPACDNGDSCKGPVSPQPGVFGAPASATFSGLANPVEPPSQAMVKPTKKTVKCPKGKTHDKHGGCVKRPEKKSKARKSTKGRK